MTYNTDNGITSATEKVVSVVIVVIVFVVVAIVVSVVFVVSVVVKREEVVCRLILRCISFRCV